MSFDLLQAPYEINLADSLDETVLDRIGADLLEQIEIDIDSRREWMENNKEWIRLASQVRESKTFPWPGASNIKFPLLTIAAMQFQARALPNLVNSAQPVRMRTIGKDPQQTKLARAIRVSKYMSYQVMEQMDEWLEEMDRLLFILPMTGIVYKKTYFSEIDDRIKSYIILPNEMIVNYHARSFDRARMTEIIPMDMNQIYEYQSSGFFRDIEVEKDPVKTDRNAFNDVNDMINPSGSDMETYDIYESHCFLDLDEDGYKEPYIVTLDRSGAVLRIVARWSDKDVFFNAKGDVQKIVPETYYTPYIFMPDPSSAVSGIGLGSLLGPINEAVNTMINQLVDAGTLSIMQGGFLGRGAKLRGGSMKFRPGEWKSINTTGDDLRASIYPLPVREPSGTLFQLLGLMVEYGQRVSSVSDMMSGENPGQNQPATTTMAVLEQGLQIFTSIYKRIHRQLSKEYKLLYRLNREYLDVDMYNTVLDSEDGQVYDNEDFEDQNVDIKPASDPSIVSQAQKSVKSQSLLEKMAMGLPLNVQEVTKRVLEAEEHEEISALMDVPAPQPDFKTQLEIQKFQHQVQMDTIDKQLENLKIRAQAVKDQTGAELNMAKTQEMGASLDMKGKELQLRAVEVQAGLLGQVMDRSLQKGEGQQQQQQPTQGE